MIKQFLFCFLFVVGFIFVFGFGHEFGHIALNDFRWTGKTCFLNCQELESEDYKFNHESTPLIGVELKKPFNELATNESVCDLVGLIFSGFYSFGALIVALKVF